MVRVAAAAREGGKSGETEAGPGFYEAHCRRPKRGGRCRHTQRESLPNAAEDLLLSLLPVSDRAPCSFLVTSLSLERRCLLACWRRCWLAGSLAGLQDRWQGRDLREGGRGERGERGNDWREGE